MQKWSSSSSIATSQCLFCCACSLFSSSAVVHQMLQVFKLFTAWLCDVQFFIQLCHHHNFIHTVTLTSSADILCPGDTVVFTCVTDTGRLVWELVNSNYKQSFHSPTQINMLITMDIFTLTLLNVTNSSTYQSTAVGHNVSVDYNNTEVSCSDGPVSSNFKQQLSIVIGKIPDFNQKLLCILIFIQIYHLHHLHLST